MSEWTTEQIVIRALNGIHDVLVGTAPCDNPVPEVTARRLRDSGRRELNLALARLNEVYAEQRGLIETDE